MSRLQVVVEDVIGVVGSDKPFHGQAHLMTEKGSADVAEVSGGDAHDEG